MFKYCLVVTFFINFASSAPSKNSTNGDATPCLRDFFQAAYDGTYNCTKTYDFFSENSKTSPFIDGKSCFLEIAKEECSSSQYNLLSTKYQDFLDVITKKSTDCSSIYYKYNALKCVIIAEDLNIKEVMIVKRHLKINDSRALEAIGLCEKVQNCMKANCYPENELTIINSYCETLKMSNTEFKACEYQIKKESPDMSEYKCLEGFDFLDQSILAQIQIYREKKDCTKEIMKDICGEKAVKDFDKYADLTAEFWLKTAKMNVAITNEWTENDQKEG